MKLPLQLDEMRAQLGRVKLEATHLTADLSEGQLWQPPPDGGWLVGECLAHLNIAGKEYAARLRPTLQASENKKGRGPFQLGFVGKLFVRPLTPDANLKLKTPKTFLPEPQAGVVERFLSLQDELLELTQLADGLELSRIVISSPVSRFLRLSAFTAFNAVTVHELRHLQQAARVKAKLE